MNMRLRRNKSHYWPILASWMLISLVVAGAGFSAYLFINRDISPIPPEIRTQLTFSPFVLPKAAKNYTTSDYKFSLAEDKVQILSYRINLDGNAITVSEYPQPSEFSEIPEYKDRFLTNIAKQYDTVQTSNGTVYLGRLARQNDKQLGIILERGLVVFMSPDKEIEPSKWRNLGDQLEIQKVVD